MMFCYVIMHVFVTFNVRIYFSVSLRDTQLRFFAVLVKLVTCLQPFV